MGCQSSLVPYEHRDYDEKNDSDIPFDFDGKNPQLGNGASGTVYKVKGVSSPFKDVKAARKVISLTAPTTKQRARKEAEAINKARHGHVVRLFMTYFYKAGNKVDFVIIMDRADGSLQDYLTGEDPRLRDQWFGCLIGAVAHIHRRGIRHRDIKPTNVLVKHKRVLLADFGISAMGLGKTIPTTVLDMARARTPEYCSPDVQDGHTRGRSADIFSLGAVFLEMLIACSSPDQFRELPVGSGNDKSYAKNIDMIRTWMDKTKQGFHTVDWHATLFSLCREMLDPDRYRRPQAKDLQSGWSGLASSNESLKCPTCAEGHPVSDSDKLITACEEGPADEVKRLLQRGADPNSAGAIHQASSYDQRDIVVTLLNYGADVNVCDLGEQIALHYAAVHGREEVVRLLLGKGADVKAQNDEGQTALHLAAGGGHMDVVQQLLNSGTDIEAKDKEEQTALHFAARSGRWDVVRLLLEKKADVEAQNDDRQTALHLAAGGGHMDVVQQLLDSAADIEAEDKVSQRALHYAAARGREDVVRLLLDKRADIRAQNDDKLTALDLAGKNMRWAVVRLLSGNGS